MSKRVSTAGMTLSYAVEETAGTRPTTASSYTQIHDVLSMPTFNPTPNSIDVTPIENAEFTEYIGGLKDLGGILEFPANLTDDLITAWNTTLITAYETGIASSKATWFCIQNPKLSKAVYFKGQPLSCGFGASEVGARMETTLYVAPQSAPVMDNKPTV